MSFVLRLHGDSINVVRFNMASSHEAKSIIEKIPLNMSSCEQYINWWHGIKLCKTCRTCLIQKQLVLYMLFLPDMDRYENSCIGINPLTLDAYDERSSSDSD